VARDPFPSDFLPPLSPDFAFFLVCVLSYDVSELAKGVDELNSRILDQAYLTEADDVVMEEGVDASGKPGGDVEMRLVDSYRPVTPDLCRIRASRSALLAIQQRHLMLKRRWAFLSDFIHTLIAYFGLREASMSNEGDPAFYSSTLRKKVDRELANLASLSHELSSIPLRIEAQQTSVDNYTSLLIASNSQVTASQSLLESKVMRMIAILTFIFLPGTFVAVSRLGCEYVASH
jgi:Mg2+ and Co2+ transporter CorA